MAKIAVFDSGLGSLSVIKTIQKHTKCEIIYFADQKNFPYGKKTKKELSKIIKNTIKFLKDKFDPEFIVMASNTPSIILDIKSSNILDVTPPIKKAIKKTKTNNIAILATQSTIQSKAFTNFITKNKIAKKYSIHKINCSELIDLVETGDFLNKKNKTRKTIKKILEEKFIKEKIDVATLSSTHLPFLRKYLEDQFPNVIFLDPADEIAKKLSKKIKPLSKNTLKIFSTDNSKVFESNLRKLNIKNKVISL